MMTPLMAEFCNRLEEALKPQLQHYINSEYTARSAGVHPPPGRRKELVDLCLNAMRLEIEKAFDEKAAPAEVQKRAYEAVKVALKQDLDRQFPQLIVKP